MHPMIQPAARTVVGVALALSVVACGGGDDEDDGAGSTTTASTTTEAAAPSSTVEETTTSTTTTAPPSGPEAPAPGDPVDGDDAATLTDEQVEAQLVALTSWYRTALLDVVEKGVPDEVTLAILHLVFMPGVVEDVSDGLEASMLAPSMPEWTVTDVAVVDSVEGCAVGTATIAGFTGLASPGSPGPTSDDVWFLLQRSPAGDGWRFGFVGATPGSEQPVNVTCSP